jgi:hypothetical protein
MIIGPVVLVFIVLLLVALTLPILRLIMGIAVLILLVLFLIDLGRGMPVLSVLVDELVVFFQALYAAIPALLDRFYP